MTFTGISDMWTHAITDYLDYLLSMGFENTTVGTRRQQLGVAAKGLGPDPYAVSGQELRAWFEAMRKHVATDTARGRRTALRVFYRWAVEQEQMPGPSPALALPRVRPAPPRPRAAPDDVWRPAVAAADPRELLALDLAGNHGLRRCEVVLVRPERDLLRDLDGWSLMVHGKGRRERVVPLTADCARRLLALGPGWAFPGAIDGHLSPRWMGKLINRLLAEGWTIHNLRHRAGKGWRKAAKGDLRIVADLLGHGDTKTTMIYTAVDDDEKRAVVKAAAA